MSDPREKHLGWRQRAVLRELRTTYNGRVAENIQRVVSAACQDIRPYMPPAETQRLMAALLRRRLVERVGPNGYRAT